MRADFQHLRRFRKSYKQVERVGWTAAITMMVTAFGTALWLGIKASLGKYVVRHSPAAGELGLTSSRGCGWRVFLPREEISMDWLEIWLAVLIGLIVIAIAVRLGLNWLIEWLYNKPYTPRRKR